MIPRFKNGDLIPNEELDEYPQTQEVILASLSPEAQTREKIETERLKQLFQDEKAQKP